MPLFMDFHKIENITAEEVISAHMADLSIQDEYGVKYHQFWVNQKAGTVFCLTEGPDAKTCEKVHQLAHGNLACAITEVEPWDYEQFMGKNQRVDRGLVRNDDGTVDTGYRNILLASIRGITTAKHSRDFELLNIPHWAKKIVFEKIREFHGREVKWKSDDSLIGLFNDATEAVKCANQIHQTFLASSQEPKVIFKIGISADQPVTENGEFFTRAIKLAHRLASTAKDNQVIISALVKELCNVDEVPGSSALRYIDNLDEQFVSGFLDVTDKNLSNKNFKIDTICENIGISRPQLYRKVRALTGRAPNNFLRDLRMDKALSLLKQKVGNVSQVALEVGYNNPSYFAKCFSDKFGYSPSEVH